MSEVIIKQIQVLVGAVPDGVPGPKTLACVQRVVAQLDEFKAQQPEVSDDAAPTLRDGSGELAAVRPEFTLGQLALEACLSEARIWGNNPVPDKHVAGYFLTCTRIGTVGIGKWLHDEQLKGKDYAFCAAAQGYIEGRVVGIAVSKLPPHRAGAIEIMRDAQAGLRPGERWAPLGEFYDERANKFIAAPPPGSLVVYQNRGDATKGHIERLIEANALGIRSVGANESGRRWVIDSLAIPWHALEKSDGTQRLMLRGFVTPVTP